MPHPAADAVLFDAVGTLFRSRGTIGEIYSEIASRHGLQLEPERLDRRFETLTAERGVPVDKERWRALVEDVFEGRDRFADFDRFFDDLFALFRTPTGWQLYPDTRLALEELAERGFRMGVVTNFDNRVVEVLSGLGVVHYFDTIQTPQSAGFRKPDPRIFLRAAGALRVAGGQGASPGRTLMVGDDPLLDLAGAEAAGMTALLVDRRPGPTRSARVIPDLSGVLGWLDRGPELLKNPPAP